MPHFLSLSAFSMSARWHVPGQLSKLHVFVHPAPGFFEYARNSPTKSRAMRIGVMYNMSFIARRTFLAAGTPATAS